MFFHIYVQVSTGALVLVHENINTMVTQKSDNPLNGIRDLAPNGTRNQWLLILAFPI